MLTPTSWYQQTVQSLGNKFLLILWHNRLPQQQYDLLKTSLILALSAYNPFAEFFQTLQKVASYHAKYNFIIQKGESLSSFLSFTPSKLNLRVFLAGHIVAMVTYCVTKIILTCSPVIGQYSDTMIVASIDKEW